MNSITKDEFFQADLKRMTMRKYLSQWLVDAYVYSGEYERAEKVAGCGTLIGAAQDEQGRLRVLSANYCKDRLCNMCAWRRSLKIFAEVSETMNEMEKRKPSAYLFLTLTVKNVPSTQLSTTLDELTSAFKRLSERELFSKTVKGFYRATEVTYNKETDSWHPHIHAVLACNKSYFSGESYVKQAEWQRMWKEALRCDYEPIVDIRRVKNTQDAPYAAAVAEIAKYTVKLSDFSGLEDEKRAQVVLLLEDVLRGRRLYAYGGAMRDAKKAVKKKISEELTDIRPDLLKGMVYYVWTGRGYKTT